MILMWERSYVKGDMSKPNLNRNYSDGVFDHTINVQRLRDVRP